MKLNKTKIIATLGPASSSKTMMSKLISSGVDVFRVNFSHAVHEDVERIVNDIKSLRVKHKKHVSILGDLQGPKIRLGTVLPNTILKKGEEIIFSTTKIKNGDSKKIERFTDVLLEYPQDTKPNEVKGLKIPDILLSGNHKAIKEWQENQSLSLTKLRRPDLITKKKDKI